jgi:hypothetical protein
LVLEVLVEPGARVPSDLIRAPQRGTRLLTNRWREDPAEAAVDPNHDGNAFSVYYLSRLDIHLADGEVFDCEDLRDGCPGMVSEPNPGSYSYIAVDTSPERTSSDSATGQGDGLLASEIFETPELETPEMETPELETP